MSAMQQFKINSYIQRTTQNWPDHPKCHHGWSVEPPMISTYFTHWGGLSQFWVVRQSIICWDHATNKKYSKWTKHLLRNNGDLISVHLWNRLYTFIPKHFLQNLKHPLVAKRTIYGRTLGRPVDSWVALGDRVTIFQQHCNMRTWALNK